MTPSILLRYIALGILIKIGSLIFLKHYEGPSTYIALAYALLLLCLLFVRPLKEKTSIF